jgi:hypothetical protein
MAKTSRGEDDPTRWICNTLRLLAFAVGYAAIV